MDTKETTGRKRGGKTPEAIQGMEFVIEMVGLDELKPHPRNYRVHPEDQLEHLAESIREHGVYRNIVTARDYTILAGHGVVQAAYRAGREVVPIYRMDLGPDDPQALKLLAGDNEIEHLAEQDDRLLSEILREVQEACTSGLLGTGFDEKMLANLVFVTRPQSEIADFNEAAAWVGMPEYDNPETPIKVVVSLSDEAALDDFVDQLGIEMPRRSGQDKITGKPTYSMWWPPREADDLSSLFFGQEPED